MLSAIGLVVFGLWAIIMSAVSYGLYNDNKRLVVKNQLLTELYDVSIKNVEVLEKQIEEQNVKIEKFKSDSISFELKVDKLNMEVEKLNSEKEEYVRMESKENKEGENKPTTSEEAIEWLKEQAASF